MRRGNKSLTAPSLELTRANTRKVVHHITASWRPEWNGTSQTRFFTSEGNKLTIKTAPQKATVAAGETVSTLTFDQVVLQKRTRQ